MGDDPEKDYTQPPPPRPIGMEPRRPSGPTWAGLPIWAWGSLAFLTLMGIAYVALMVALGIGVTGVPAPEEAATPVEGDVRPAHLFVAGFYEALSYHDYVYASTLVAPPLSQRYDPTALRARWEAFESNQGRVVVLEPESAGENVVVQRLRTNEGTVFEVRVTVERANGTWRIVAAEPDLVPAR
jgi:hypothetical protein